MVCVGVVGCAHSQFDAIYGHIDAYNNAASAVDGGRPIELLLCCRDVQCRRNTRDLECEACPRRYRKMNEFHEYYSGAKRASVLTILIGGNHEASNYLQELHYGGWIAPLPFYLGAAGVVNVLGLRIVGLSGIYDAKDYRRGHCETVPYSKNELYSVFHTRESEVFQLSHLQSPVDIVMSNDWPRKIEEYGDTDALIQLKPHFEESAAADSFGSVAGETLLHTLQPRHWFAGHMHVRFEATVPHGRGEEASTTSSSSATRFLALDKCNPARPWLEVVDVEPASSLPRASLDSSGDLRVMMDVEWLAVLRATHRLMSRSSSQVKMPTAQVKIGEADFAWVRRRLAAEADRITEGERAQSEWIGSFQVTAPSHSRAAWSDNPLGNPQTDALLELLELPHVLTSPYHPGGCDSDDSANDTSKQGEEWDCEGSDDDDEVGA